MSTLSTDTYVDARAMRITPAAVPSEVTPLGQRLLPTREININKQSSSTGLVTILTGHGRFYIGRINEQLVLVEVLDASEVATIVPGTTLLATET